MPEAKIVPTVGRSVHYRTVSEPDQLRPAIVTKVIDEEKDIVNVAIFLDDRVMFSQNVARGGEGAQWDWMPYQKGQAKKNEELEEELKK